MAKTGNASAQIDDYLDGKDPGLRKIANGLRRLCRKTVPGLTESVNSWGLPTLVANGPIGYFSVGRKHVTFGFLRATALDDPGKLLEGTGKNLRHVKLRGTGDLRRPGLRKLILAAARLDRREPAPGMRRRRAK